MPLLRAFVQKWTQETRLYFDLDTPIPVEAPIAGKLSSHCWRVKVSSDFYLSDAMFMRGCYSSHASLSLSLSFQLMWSTFIYTHSLSHPHSSTHTHTHFWYWSDHVFHVFASHLHKHTLIDVATNTRFFTRAYTYGYPGLHMRARWNTLMGMRIVVHWLSIVKCWFAHDPPTHLQLSIPLHLRINHIRWTLFPFLFTEAKFAWQTSNTIF